MMKQDKSKTLKERLEAFQKELKKYKESTKEQLLEVLSNDLFPDLAKGFLYGGYISVGVQNENKETEERYRIYPTTVEFYFHCEDGSDYKIEDPIVYHQDRNVPRKMKSPKEKVIDEFPYFPLMTLHAHASGYDITFENGEDGEKYRASALIRKYEVLVANTGEKIPEERSTYLYDYLNGFPLLGENIIKWEDEFKEESAKVEGGTQRKNVYKYTKGKDGRYVFAVDKDGNKEKDGRMWSFSKKVDKKS